MFCLYGICYEVRIVYCQSSIKSIFILRLLTCTYYCLSLLQKANHQVRSHLQVSRLGNCPNCLVLQPKPQYKVPFVHLRRYISQYCKTIGRGFRHFSAIKYPYPLVNGQSVPPFAEPSNLQDICLLGFYLERNLLKS